MSAPRRPDGEQGGAPPGGSAANGREPGAAAHGGSRETIDLSKSAKDGAGHGATNGDTTAHDPRLLAALRHAPDADLGVPPLLRASIVGMAYRHAGAARRKRPWWRRLDPVATPWRMGGAGTAAAAVLAATVLWVGRDEQPEAPRPDATAMRSSRSSAPPSTTPAVPATASESKADAPPQGVAAGGSSTAVPAPARAPQAGTPGAQGERARSTERNEAESAAAARARAQQAELARRAEEQRAREATGNAGAADPRADAARMAERAVARDGGGAHMGAAAPQRAEPPPAASLRAATAAPDPARATRSAPAPAASPMAPPAAPAAPPPPPPSGNAEATRGETPESGAVRPPLPAAAQAPPATAQAPAPAAAEARGAAPPSTSPSPFADLAPRAAADSTPARAAPPAAPATTAPAPPRAALRADAPAAAAPLPAQPAAPPALRAMVRPLLDAVLSQPDRSAWRRRSAGGDAALPAGWWERLDEATRGRWAGSPFNPDAASDPVPDASSDTWLLQHATSGRQLRLTWANDSIALCDTLARRCERARVEAPVLQSLRAQANR